MKFKEFLVNEEIGLGDLGTRIDKLFQNQAFSNQAGAFVNSSLGGPGEQNPTLGDPLHSLFLPDTQLTIPQQEKSGRITVLLRNRNPIYVRLSDGTEASFTYDEWRRIEGQPALGKIMTIIFQRHNHDLSELYSKIDKVIVHD